MRWRRDARGERPYEPGDDLSSTAAGDHSRCFSDTERGRGRSKAKENGKRRDVWFSSPLRVATSGIYKHTRSNNHGRPTPPGRKGHDPRSSRMHAGQKAMEGPGRELSWVAQQHRHVSPDGGPADRCHVRGWAEDDGMGQKGERGDGGRVHAGQGASEPSSRRSGSQQLLVCLSNGGCPPGARLQGPPAGW